MSHGNRFLLGGFPVLVLIPLTGWAPIVVETILRVDVGFWSSCFIALARNPTLAKFWVVEAMAA